MKTAEEIKKEISTKRGTPLNSLDIIDAMKEYAREALIEFRNECAINAKLGSISCGDAQTCGCMGNCQHPVFYVNKKSILELDIEKHLI